MISYTTLQGWPHWCLLTHWGRDKMAAISQTTHLNVFSWMKMLRVSIKISLKFVPKGPINNCPSLVQIMAWRRPGDKPLSEPMMVRLLTYICVIRPQWVKRIFEKMAGVIMAPYCSFLLLTCDDASRAQSHDLCHHIPGSDICYLQGMVLSIICMPAILIINWYLHMGQVTKVRLSCNLVLLSDDSKTR